MVYLVFQRVYKRFVFRRGCCRREEMEAKRQRLEVEDGASKEAAVRKREAALEASRSERQYLLCGDRYAVFAAGGAGEQLGFAFGERVDARVEAVGLRVEQARLLGALLRPPRAHEPRPAERHPTQAASGALVEHSVVGLVFEGLESVAVARRALESDHVGKLEGHILRVHIVSSHRETRSDQKGHPNREINSTHLLVHLKSKSRQIFN